MEHVGHVVLFRSADLEIAVSGRLVLRPYLFVMKDWGEMMSLWNIAGYAGKDAGKDAKKFGLPAESLYKGVVGGILLRKLF